MNCPFCGYNESKVVDSRPSDEGVTIRRRRECLSCGGRFTTFEILETTPLIVVKKDKSRQPFDRDKLLRSVMKACAKRPIPLEVLEKMVNEVEYYYRNSFTKEVTSTDLGELVMENYGILIRWHMSGLPLFIGISPIYSSSPMRSSN